jgi:pimeloyl-ACP methyl ester carboxylesterase
VHLRDERHILAGVPVRVVRPAHDDAPPLALWFHGFRAAADDNADELAALAVDGVAAVGVDAVGHGARRDPDLPARLAASPGGALPIMLAQADATARELPALVRALGEARLGDPSRVSLVGVSMGGFLAYRAATLLDPPPRAVVALLGSPEWPGDDSPHRRPAAFDDVALRSITAGRDESVPPDAARRFHAALATSHPRPERTSYVELPDAPHLIDGAQWAAAMAATREWLRAHGR